MVHDQTVVLNELTPVFYTPIKPTYTLCEPSRSDPYILSMVLGSGHDMSMHASVHAIPKRQRFALKSSNSSHLETKHCNGNDWLFFFQKLVMIDSQKWPQLSEIFWLRSQNGRVPKRMHVNQ